MLRAIRAAVHREWTALEVGVEPTRLILLFCILVMVPRYHAFSLGHPVLNQYVVFQIGLPLLIIPCIYRQSPARWGLGMGDLRLGLALTGLFLVLYLPGFFAMVSNDQVAAYYRHAEGAGTFDWHAWSVRRLVSLLTMARTEIFYRGFLLFGLRKTFKTHEAILLHLIPYGIAHLGKPELECYGSLVVGYFLGYLSLRVESVWYGTFLHWFFSSAFQVYFVFAMP